MSDSEWNVALFVTCPVDLFRPEVGFATAKILVQAGCRVSVPPQSCCGQIAFNNGLADEARLVAWQIVCDFSGYDYVILPSGSCGGMIVHHYPELFRGDPRLAQVQAFCDRVFELTVFLHDVLHWLPEDRNCDLSSQTVAYHDSCAGLREMGIRPQPRALLKRCANAEVAEIQDTDVCCGFGGSFCMKFPDIASRMAQDKLVNAGAVAPAYLVGGDVSCLLHLAGKWQREHSEARDTAPLEIRHVAELLAGELDTPPMNALSTRQQSKKS